MEHYLCQAQTHRSTLPEPDVTLERLRQAVFAFLEIKEEPRSVGVANDGDLDKDIHKFSHPPGDAPSGVGGGMTITAEEKAAWEAAGMPSPFEGFIKEYRRGRR